MYRIFILASLLTAASSLQAQHQSCLVHIDKFEDVNKLTCSAGDYTTFWNHSKTTHGFLLIKAVMMHACDLSKPFETQSAGNVEMVNSATCVLREVRLAVIADDEKSTTGIE